MKRLIVVFAILSAVPLLRAQSADDYFHTAANEFINARIAPALQAVDDGLRIDPDNPRLNALKEKLEEEKQKQQQQQQQQQGQQNQQQDQQDQNDGQQEQPEQDQQEQMASEQQKDEQKQGDKPEDKEEQQAQAMQEDPDKMSKEDAERILDALKNDEREKQDLKKPVRATRRMTDKDW